MSDTDVDLEAEEGEDGAEGGKAKASRFGKKRVLIYGGALLLLLGGSGAAVHYLGLFDATGENATKEVVKAKNSVFYDLPDITVNLASVEQRSQYLRMKVALEVSNRDAVHAIVPKLPRVLDAFQVYLRELRTTDLEGSAGLYRLKEELRRRVNLAVHPAEVDDILFKELLIQ